MNVQEVEIAASDVKEDELLAVNDALEAFAARDPQKAPLSPTSTGTMMA